MNAPNGGRKLPRLITFPPSADSETGRWALDHYGVEVDERRHAPPFIFAAVGLNKGEKFPLYLDGGLTLSGVEQILEHFEERVPAERRLIPPEHRERVDALWKRFNATMGARVVTWAYTHLLPHRAIMIRPLSLGAPAYQRQFVKWCYPIPKRMLWNALKLDRPAADEARVTIEATFAHVDELLADGRRWLAGDRMTLADLSFAVSGAPLVLPEGYGGYPGDPGPVPTLEQWPAEPRALIERTRRTPAGRFILRMYAEERYRDRRTPTPMANSAAPPATESMLEAVD